MSHITICGSKSVGSLGTMCQRAFEEIGHEVRFVSKEIPSFYDHFGIGVDKIRDIGVWKMREKVITECTSSKSDLILIIKGYDLDRDTINQIQEQTNAIVANWNPDNPFQVRSSKKLAETYLESLPAYDIVFTWGEFLMDRLSKYGAQQVEHLPFGYDPELQQPMDPDSKYACDVIFLGQWSKKRERLLSHITDLDIDFDLWGNQLYWKLYCWNIPLRRCLRGGKLWGEDYAKAMSSAKIVVNIVADHNVPAYNMRTFEIPATGSFMLTTDTKGQRSIFDPGREAAMYSTGEELKEKIEYYLENDEERKAVSARGYKCVQGHSYRHRMKRILEVAEV